MASKDEYSPLTNEDFLVQTMHDFRKELNSKFELVPKNDPLGQVKSQDVVLEHMSGKILIQLKKDTLMLPNERRLPVPEPTPTDKPQDSEVKAEVPVDDKTNTSNSETAEDGSLNTKEETETKSNEVSPGGVDNEDPKTLPELEDKTFSYYDIDSNNRFLLLISIFDDKYSDKHRLLLLNEVFLKTEFDSSSKVRSSLNPKLTSKGRGVDKHEQLSEREDHLGKWSVEPFDSTEVQPHCLQVLQNLQEVLLPITGVLEVQPQDLHQLQIEEQHQ
jgi:hypothetical protein